MWAFTKRSRLWPETWAEKQRSQTSPENAAGADHRRLQLAHSEIVKVHAAEIFVVLVHVTGEAVLGRVSLVATRAMIGCRVLLKVVAPEVPPHALTVHLDSAEETKFAATFCRRSVSPDQDVQVWV